MSGGHPARVPAGGSGTADPRLGEAKRTMSFADLFRTATGNKPSRPRYVFKVDSFAKSRFLLSEEHRDEIYPSFQRFIASLEMTRREFFHFLRDHQGCDSNL
jgi:hypothetical protein